MVRFYAELGKRGEARSLLWRNLTAGVVEFFSRHPRDWRVSRYWSAELIGIGGGPDEDIRPTSADEAERLAQSWGWRSRSL